MGDWSKASLPAEVFRVGGPDVMWTEFVSADGLFLGGKDALLRDLSFTESERPIVAQFFTAHPDMMRRAAALALALGFDGVDINMGCPDRTIEKQGAGAALMKNPALARELVAAAKEGTEEKIPVSIKTRLGYNKIELETWLPSLLLTNPAAIIIHARTRKEMSKVPARWEYIKRAVEIRNAAKSDTFIVGNGDVMALSEARACVTETGADGVMLGKAIFGNPWLFDEGKGEVSREEKLRMAVEHTKLFEDFFKDTKNFAIMKKHYKVYVHGWDGAKELRGKLMEARSADEVAQTVEAFLKSSKATVL